MSERQHRRKIGGKKIEEEGKKKETWQETLTYLRKSNTDFLSWREQLLETQTEAERGKKMSSTVYKFILRGKKIIKINKI